MPNSRHAAKLGEGARPWNAWRRANAAVVPDLNDLAVPVGHRQFGSVQGGPIDLSRAELCRAALEHATLIGADLTGARLVEADLSYARLTGADLRGANLSHALLEQADLEDARLDAATVFGAQLQHARNLTQAQIEQTSGDENTALPPHLAMPRAWRRHDHAGSSQVARRSRAGMEDPRADPYALLGVRPGASMQEVRAAYLMLVKELHPDGRMLDPIAGERLKAINKAYHDIKTRARRAASRRAESGFFGRPGALFVIGFLASSTILSAALGVLHYGGYLGREAIPTTAETVQPELPRAARADDIITGSLPQPSGTGSTHPDVREVAKEQADAARAANLDDAADDAAWAEARRTGTSVALHRYLGSHPAGRHAGEATEELKAVVACEVALDQTYDWRHAPTVEAARRTLRHCLDTYPGGGLAAEVRNKLAALDAGETVRLADKAAWAEADRTATREAMQTYLEAYPDGSGALQARTAITTLEVAEARQRADRDAWAQAEGEGTKEALRAYLTAHPLGGNVERAQQAIAAIEAADARQRADRVAWAEVEAEGTSTKAALRKYLDAHPQGTHAAAARQALARIEAADARQRADRDAWAAAEQDGTAQALGRYLDAFPDGEHATQARQKLASLATVPAEAGSDKAKLKDDADWAKALRRNTKAAYAVYLRGNPQGRHAERARASIAELESVKAKAAPSAQVQAGKPGLRSLRTDTIDAPASANWPSADEPFIGPDGRIRQKWGQK